MTETLLDTIMADIKTAMKAHEMAAVTALRGLHAQIKDATVNAGKPLTDEAVISCVNKAIKQREDSIDMYRKGNREDLVEKEQAELDLIKKYQPKQMSREEVAEIVKAVIAELGITSVKERGKLMGTLMPRVKGKADGRLVNEIVQSLLSK